MNDIRIEHETSCCDATQPEFFDITLSSGYSYAPPFPSILTINERECYIDHLDETDISRLLMADRDFIHSIERGKEQMRKGSPYFSHEEVFGG